VEKFRPWSEDIMKATEAKILPFIKKSPQFVIPIYQRNYSWTEDECRQLWEDILRAGHDDAISAHFIGAIVYVEKGLYQVMSQPPLLVIDGQQRLTTISLLLIALAELLDDQEPWEGFSARKIRNYYLVNPEESAEKHYKLLLAQSDKATLLHLLGGPEPAEASLRIRANYEFFRARLKERQDDLVPVCQGLAKLIIVDVSLNRDQDNPQLIFESMNSTGRKLSQADLIRNFLLMGLEPEQQTSLYEKYWRPMELGFGQEAYTLYFDSFMRHYLTMKTGAWPRFDEVYAAFKEYARKPEVIVSGVEALINDLREYAGYYRAMAFKGQESDATLARAFFDLRELKVDVAYPLLLELYHDFATEVLSRDDFLEAVRLVESYVFRRAACAIPTNSLNKTFMTFSRILKKDRYLESFKAGLLLLQSYRRFPSDDEFIRELQIRNLYTNRLRSYWPRRLENHGRKEWVPVDEYTVEHIMPQNENLSAEWRTELGPDWRRIQETWLHTLGNLTLTGYNSEYSDKPFKEKRDMEGGFKDSPLRLNKGLGPQERWNEEAICQRAARLAGEATKVWPIPALEPGILQTYKTCINGSGYSLEDHPFLFVSPIKELFEAFRLAVLAIDPCVAEDILKLYIAYKAETNFVDVVPQAKRLRLSLNMRFHELDDPRGLCKDVSDLGRWGNGDVEVGLTSLDDLPYVMSLIRQAFERQMGNGESE
jgi:uncharacterized protein with ParB-like and HNH nuclease domain/predicted transport protein